MGVPSDKHKVTTGYFAKICKELRALQYQNENIVQMCFYILKRLRGSLKANSATYSLDHEVFIETMVAKVTQKALVTD